jgi:hypothetical protein
MHEIITERSSFFVRPSLLAASAISVIVVYGACGGTSEPGPMPSVGSMGSGGTAGRGGSDGIGVSGVGGLGEDARAAGGASGADTTSRDGSAGSAAAIGLADPVRSVRQARPGRLDHVVKAGGVRTPARRAAWTSTPAPSLVGATEPGIPSAKPSAPPRASERGLRLRAHRNLPLSGRSRFDVLLPAVRRWA